MDEKLINTDIPVDENGEVTRKITLQLPSPIRAASTYAMATEDENRVHTLDILLFKVDQGNETYAYTVHPTSIEDVGGNSHFKEVTMKLKADGQSYRLVFLANVSDEIATQIPDIPAVGEKEDVLERLTHTITADKKWQSGDYFPMWGESNVVTISDANSLDSEEIKMLRAVSRIDVVTTDEVTNFELTSTYVYKYHRKGHVVPKAAYVGSNHKVTDPTIPSESLIVDKSGKFTATDGGIRQEIYVYESEKNDKHLEKTCVVVGGIYKPTGYQGDGSDLDTSYYRIDFIDTNKKDIHLLRNHCYTLRIKSVKGDGYDDEDEAYENQPFNVDVEILEWDQGDINDIVFGQYFLGVSRSEIYMPSPEDTTSIIVTTDYPLAKGGWTADFTATTWLNHESGVCTGELVKDRLVFRLDENTGDSQRVGYIHLRAGVLKHTITVYQEPPGGEEGPPDDVNFVQGGEGNCYILSPTADGIIIPVSQANIDGQTRIKENDQLEVEVLWTDTEAAVGDPNCVIRYVGINKHGASGSLFVAANKIVGNALVAVKVDGIIRWSWHIWVQEYQPEVTAKTYIGDVTQTWMDRNLGALSGTPGEVTTMGFTYQFGRKDPFPGMASFQNASPTRIFDAKGKEVFIEIKSPSSGLDMLEESIENPMTYYKGFSASKDWYASTGGQNTEFWLKDQGVSTPYDPCPDGWTINSKIDVWYEKWNFGFPSPSTVIYGIESPKIGYWPTPGYRNEDGTLLVDQVGKTGYYWMGQPNGWDFGNAIEIELTKNGNDAIEVGKGKNKAWGLSVRCVKE